MNAPSHAVINLVLLGGRDLGARALPIVLGAVLPDVPGYAFYAYFRLAQGLPDSIIWGELYLQPFWQDLLGPFHSLPLGLLLLLVALALRRAALVLFAASLLLHAVVDLPLHHTDAPRFFFPLHDFRLRSPWSYWDRAYHADVVSLVELALLGGGVLHLCWRTRSTAARAALGAVTAVMLGLWASGLLFWNSVPREPSAPPPLELEPEPPPPRPADGGGDPDGAGTGPPARETVPELR